MERLTKKVESYGVDAIYHKLSLFEDFMEEQGFEDLEHLDLTLKNLSYGAKYYVFWERLKEYIDKSIESDNKYLKSFPNNMNFENYRTSKRVILETMKELEKECKKNK